MRFWHWTARTDKCNAKFQISNECGEWDTCDGNKNGSIHMHCDLYQYWLWSARAHISPACAFVCRHFEIYWLISFWNANFFFQFTSFRFHCFIYIDHSPIWAKSIESNICLSVYRKFLFERHCLQTFSSSHSPSLHFSHCPKNNELNLLVLNCVSSFGP